MPDEVGGQVASRLIVSISGAVSSTFVGHHKNKPGTVHLGILGRRQQQYAAIVRGRLILGARRAETGGWEIFHIRTWEIRNKASHSPVFDRFPLFYELGNWLALINDMDVQHLSWRGREQGGTARQQHDLSACMVTLDQTLGKRGPKPSFKISTDDSPDGIRSRDVHRGGGRRTQPRGPQTTATLSTFEDWNCPKGATGIAEAVPVESAAPPEMASARSANFSFILVFSLRVKSARQRIGSSVNEG
jgi:hypothetical protein